MKKLIGTLVILLIVPFMPALAEEQLSLAQNTPQSPAGRISGKVVDAESDAPIIGARVVIEGVTPAIGAVTDLNGNYTLQGVPAGSHTIVVTYPEYAKMEVSGVELSSGATRQQDIALKSEVKQVEGKAVEVVAKASRGSQAGLLKDRQKAAAVSDAIGAEEIVRSGSSNAAQAMSRVTGATVMDGKYIYVRGLGERYSTTELNGAQLPSADPNKRAVQMDLFAANLLDDIVTVKSYTPDKPGNFTGGSVNLVTKSYPDKFTTSLSLSSAYNPQFSLKNGFLTSPGGSRDWLGMDDGTRDIPVPLQDPSVVIPLLTPATRRDSVLRNRLSFLSRSFNSDMAPTKKMAPLNRNFAFSMGNEFNVLGRPLGLLGSLSYNRGYNSYSDGTTARWYLRNTTNTAAGLEPVFVLHDSKSSDEVVWGGLANLSFQPQPEHELKATYMYNRSGESMARFLSGPARFVGENSILESRVVQYTERSLGSFQLSGHHLLPSLLGMDLNWSGSIARTRQDEPDLRFFADYYDTIPDTAYTIKTNAFDYPTRNYRYTKENNSDFNLDVSFPFKQWSGLSGKLKLGGYLFRKDRTYRERRFHYEIDPGNAYAPDYNGDPQFFFSDSMVGLWGYDSVYTHQYIFGTYIRQDNTGRNNYDGDQKISAAFGMLDFPIFSKLRFAGGVRLELTRMQVASLDTSLRKAFLSNDDWLPSANLIYQLGQSMNLRGSYSRTLARPEFRELAVYSSYDFVGDFVFGGNPNLKRTLIHNYDLRWEWFERPGEIYSISGFYKRFINPIERVRVSGGDEDLVSSRNVPQATVLGMEVEVRKRLDQIASFLQYFQAGANLTLVRSRVDIDTLELRNTRTVDPGAKAYRQLQGQSPYVLNLDFSYNNFKRGTTASLMYNVFGRRLAEVSNGGMPNVMEEPRAQLDFTCSQKVFHAVVFKVSAKNLLNSEYKKVYHFHGQEYPYQIYKAGRFISLGLSWAID